MNKHRTDVKLNEIIVWEDELLLNSLFMKVDATVILFLSSLLISFDPPFMGSLLHYIIFF